MLGLLGLGLFFFERPLDLDLEERELDELLLGLGFFFFNPWSQKLYKFTVLSLELDFLYFLEAITFAF